jgi:hypothetical protein
MQNKAVHSHISDPLPVSYTMRREGYFYGAKQQGCEINHSPASNGEVKNVGSVILLHIRLHGVVLS